MRKIIKTERKSEYKIADLILHRWSPRAMSGEKITEDQLMTLIEAARWAPSSYNNQPWRFIYGIKGTKHWDKIFSLMGGFNQQWTAEAGALVVVIAKRNFEYDGKPSRTYAFDTGAAWQNIALQGYSMGLVIHGMEGFDYEKAAKELKIPSDYEIQMMFAVGKPGKKEDLTKDLQERELPSDRKKISEIAYEGGFQT